MIERDYGARFLLKALQPFRIPRKAQGQEFERCKEDFLNRLEPRRRHFYISPRITRINANKSERNIGKVGFRFYALRLRNAFIFQARIVPKIHKKTKFKSGRV